MTHTEQPRPPLELPEISDATMNEALLTSRQYTIVIVKKGPAYDPPRSDGIIREHGRRNFALRAAGLLSIVCPIRDGGPVAGIGIFDAEPVDVERLMADDPAVTAAVLTFEVHPTLSFAGDCLPAGRARSPGR